MSTSWRVAAAATFALIALQWAWDLAVPHPHLPSWVMSTLWTLPLLPPAIAFALRRRRAPLWAGILALFYFCWGVSGLRWQPNAWEWAETLLSLAIVFAAGWPGIAAKIAKRRAAPPPNV